MKKFLGILILVATFMTPASAQITFGVKGGVNVTNMSFSKDVFNASNRAGFYIGPSVKFTLPIVGLGIDASAQYDQREAKVEDQAITAKSINIPINVRYTIGLGDLAGIYFAAGPQFGFNVGGKNFSWTSSDSYKNTFKMKDSNFSINLGAGVMLVKHLEIGVCYNIVCGKTGDVSASKVESSVSDNIKDADSRSNAWQISAAYYF